MADKSILLVDDNPDDVELTERAFQKAGVGVPLSVARDGVEALERLLGPGAPPLPDVVLLDINMPKLSGLDVLERLRADPRTKTLPVVMLTSSAEESDLLRSYRGGCNSYVRKPVSFAAFVEAARQLGVYWLQLNRPAPHEAKP